MEYKLWLQLWLQSQIVVVAILDIAENCQQMLLQLLFGNANLDIIGKMWTNVAAIVDVNLRWQRLRKP